MDMTITATSGTFSMPVDVPAPVDHLAASLWAYAVTLGAAHDDADDAVQEALARLLEKQASGGLVREERAWLYTTVHHLVVDHMRWRLRSRRLLTRLAAMREPRETVSPPISPVDEVWRAVDRLPERQRAAIYLRYRADMPFATIADVMRVTEGAARSYVTKGLDRLEALLTEAGG